jgi:purine-binding chemotaxis protein CheW
MAQTTTQQLVTTAKMGEEDTQRGKYLTFPLGNEVFGIEIRFVTEIIGIQSITYVPEVPAYVKGIINLRGKIIPVIDIRLKFKKDVIPYDDRTCIIVIDIKDTSIGLIVDCVSEVIDIKDDNIVPPPGYKTGFQNKFIQGIGKVGDEIKLLLDCEKILSDGDVEVLEATAS